MSYLDCLTCGCFHQRPENHCKDHNCECHKQWNMAYDATKPSCGLSGGCEWCQPPIVRPRSDKPTTAAMKAAEAVRRDAVDTSVLEHSDWVPFNQLEAEATLYDTEKAAIAIDRETGLPELLEALKAADKAMEIEGFKAHGYTRKKVRAALARFLTR